MLRVLTCLLGGAVLGSALGGCDWPDACPVGGLKCNGSVIEECEQTPNGYTDWRQRGDCLEIDSRCIDDGKGHAQCEYGPR